MEQKIVIEICVGTSCHLMGSNMVMEYIDNLSDDIKEMIDLKHVSCMNECSEGPMVKVDDTIISHANPEKLAEVLKKKIRKNKG